MSERYDSEDSAYYEDMDVSLLARQPLEPKPQKDEDWQPLYSFLSAKFQSLRAWRYMKWSYWSVLARYFVPFRYVWVVTANRMSRGEPVNDSIIDSTGVLAVRTCAAGMWTGLTSPSRPWLKIDQAVPWAKLDRPALEWLKQFQEGLYTVFNQSNFYSQMAVAFRDLVWSGTAPVIIYEDHEDVIRLYVPSAGEYFLDSSGRLTVDTMYREFAFNVMQIIDMFGVDNCPEQVTKLWREGGAALQTEFIVAHAIEPNVPVRRTGESNPNQGVRPVSEKFSFREIYWLRDIKTARPLSKRGFKSKPFIAMRWSLSQNDPYGHGPCEESLGDNKEIQLATRRKAEFIGKGVRPPMGADPALKNEPATTIEGQITYFSTEGGRKGFFPLFEPNPAWLPGLVASIEKVSERIEKCLFVKLFMAISQMEGVQPRNQLELTKRDLERLQELGPVIDLVEGELNILIMRVYDIMMRRKMLPPPPPSLTKVPLKITYTSILRLAQRSAESVAMKDVFQTAGVMSSAAKAAGVPDPLRTINLDDALRHYADLNGFPATLFFTDGEIAHHDQIRQEEQQKAQMPQQAMAAVNAAHTMASTQMPGGGSALGAVLGQ
jgi:hypothetical protein